VTRLLFHAGGASRRQVLGVGIAASAVALVSGKAAYAETAPTLRIRRLAWAGIRLQLPKATLFVDPLIDPAVWGSALPDELIGVDDAVGDSVVLVTHRHSDHADPAAIAAALAHGGTLAYAAGTPPFGGLPDHVRQRPCPLWEPQLLGDFTATPVPASDGYGDLQVSWVVSGGGRRIFHGGDTMMHGGWWRVGRQFGRFDAAFLPVNGAAFSFQQPATDEPAVLTPKQAIAAATILGAERIVPIHYGIAGAEGYAEMPDLLDSLRGASKPGGPRVAILKPGEWLDWQG
jgi:L-ascorbate metabolism protein UlaG (beta-lactamase superfamily)